ncbi:anti-sigma factor RsiW [Ensifer sp. KUDG1]|uniref:anti-sigma factor family protein n=1 Tax=unclassified Ensifer TaxID=2633371 RepID=UPI0005BAA35B|nr:anti-sigma factor [Ensifer sp. ZNC0028]
MQQTRGQALEVRLSAYIDGEIGEAERTELDAILARDEDAKALFERLKAGSSFGDTAFEDFLHDPVPLALVRQIKQGPGSNPKTERIAATTTTVRHARVWPRMVAASVALLLLGAGAGFIVGTANTGSEPTKLAAARGWLDDIADYHRIYSRQKEHLVEVPATEAPKIETWLASSVGVPFKIPQLSGKGLTFEGARLLVANGKPVAQLVYRSAEGEIFAICFLKSTTGPQADQFDESIRDDLGMVSWQRGGASFVLVGPSSHVGMQDIAEAAAATI